MAETIFKAMADSMRDIKAVGKDGVNRHDSYNFRGIDGVMNAVGPVFRQHGIIPVPEVVQYSHEPVMSSTGKPMTSVTLQMVVHFYGPAGDCLDCTVWGEAFDRGDKATAKAHSVAFRTAMLQTLCLPTQEPDPDEDSYERGDGSSAVVATVGQLLDSIHAAESKEELTKLWNYASGNGLARSESVSEAFKRRGEELKA